MTEEVEDPEAEAKAIAILTEFVINEREKRRFTEWPSLDSLLPITMDNGYVIMNPIFCCTMCNDMTMYGENLRGEFRIVPGGDIRLTGYGLCPICRCLSTLRQHYRQQEDGTIEVQLILRDDAIPITGAEIILFQRPKRKRRKHVQEGNKETSNTA